MSNTDEQIETILARYGEPMTGSVWQAEGETFIHHKTLERIAGKAKITFDPPTILRTERDEAVLLVIGRLGERMEWSIGEALVGVNYHLPRSEAAYVYAMAEKRGKDRVILTQRTTAPPRMAVVGTCGSHLVLAGDAKQE